MSSQLLEDQDQVDDLLRHSSEDEGRIASHLRVSLQCHAAIALDPWCRMLGDQENYLHCYSIRGG